MSYYLRHFYCCFNSSWSNLPYKSIKQSVDVFGMPALVKYDRKPLTGAQLFALRTYIRRKRLEDGNVSTNGVEDIHENDKQEETPGSVPQAISDTPATPPPPTAQEIHEEKERSLKDIGEQLNELEHVLDGLKQKKHELFEEFKSLLSSETKNKKQAEERERQMHGFPPPFMGQSAGQVGLMNVSPYRSGLIGVKRPKSPSPPLVQLYSPGSSSTLQPLFNSPQAHHPTQTAVLGQGDVPRSTFGQQINFSSRDPRQMAHGTQDNPRPPLLSQPAASHYAGTQERQFLDSRHLQDRHLPSNFGNPQSSGQGATGPQNRPRQSQMNHPPSFLQQNAFSGQQQAVANSTDGGFTAGVGSFAKERPGFNTPDSHRPQGYVKRGVHPPNRSSRYY